MARTSTGSISGASPPAPRTGRRRPDHRLRVGHLAHRDRARERYLHHRRRRQLDAPPVVRRRSLPADLAERRPDPVLERRPVLDHDRGRRGCVAAAGPDGLDRPITGTGLPGRDCGSSLGPDPRPEAPAGSLGLRESTAWSRRASLPETILPRSLAAAAVRAGEPSPSRPRPSTAWGRTPRCRGGGAGLRRQGTPRLRPAHRSPR